MSGAILQSACSACLMACMWLQADRPAHYVAKSLQDSGIEVIPVPVYACPTSPDCHSRHALAALHHTMCMLLIAAGTTPMRRLSWGRRCTGSWQMSKAMWT